MKDTKVSSDARVQANRANALNSTGPKTPRGKRFSRRNALKHGLYSKALLIPEADTPAFIEFRRDLEEQLKPVSAMQRLAFDSIVVCAWSAKLGTRIEDRQFAKVLESADSSLGDTTDAVADSRPSRWWGADRQSIRAAIKALDYAQAEFDSLGYFREDTKEFLSRAFGPEFLETLTQWAPLNMQAALLANTFVEHTANFGGDVYPRGLQPADKYGSGSDTGVADGREAP
jgi:hypothetical protein